MKSVCELNDVIHQIVDNCYQMVLDVHSVMMDSIEIQHYVLNVQNDVIHAQIIHYVIVATIIII